LTLTERASDATRAPAYEPIPAASTNLMHAGYCQFMLVHEGS
jgi:hypothetical protein